MRACVRACVRGRRADRWKMGRRAHTQAARGLAGEERDVQGQGTRVPTKGTWKRGMCADRLGPGSEKGPAAGAPEHVAGEAARSCAGFCVCVRARVRAWRMSRWFRSASGQEKQGGEQGLSASRTSAAAPPRRRTRRRRRRAGHGPPQLLAGAGCNGEAEAAPDAAAMRTAPPPARKTCRAIAQAPPPTPP